MKLKDIFEKENKRSESNLNLVYFFNDGNGWFKAYEWSAYLAEFFPNNIGKQLKATKRKYSGVDGSTICVSLKSSSIDNYLPNCEIIKSTEDGIAIKVDISKYDESFTFNDYRKFLEKWKDTVEMTVTPEKNKDNPKKTDNVFTCNISFSTILRDVICYEVYGKDEEGLREFIMMLKNKCASIMC